MNSLSTLFFWTWMSCLLRFLLKKVANRISAEKSNLPIVLIIVYILPLCLSALLSLDFIHRKWIFKRWLFYLFDSAGVHLNTTTTTTTTHHYHTWFSQKRDFKSCALKDFRAVGPEFTSYPATLKKYFSWIFVEILAIRFRLDFSSTLSWISCPQSSKCFLESLKEIFSSLFFAFQVSIGKCCASFF